MFGHHDVAEDVEVVAVAGEFEGVEEDVSGVWGVEVGFSIVTTEGDEVVVTFFLIPFEAQRHGWILLCLDPSSGVENRVPHLRRDLIATKVGYRAEHDPVFRAGRVSGFSLPRKLPILAAFGVEDGAPGHPPPNLHFSYEDVFVFGIPAPSQ